MANKKRSKKKPKDDGKEVSILQLVSKNSCTEKTENMKTKLNELF